MLPKRTRLTWLLGSTTTPTPSGDTPSAAFLPCSWIWNVSPLSKAETKGPPSLARNLWQKVRGERQGKVAFDRRFQTIKRMLKGVKEETSPSGSTEIRLSLVIEHSMSSAVPMVSNTWNWWSNGDSPSDTLTKPACQQQNSSYDLHVQSFDIPLLLPCG